MTQTQNNSTRTVGSTRVPCHETAGMSFFRAVVVFVFLSALLGLIYPAVVTGVAQVLFPHQANGSLISVNGRVVGSEIIGQDWRDTGVFEGRASATDHNAASSSGSNHGMSNPDHQANMKARADRWKALTGSTAPVPQDLITASSSGIDPEITLEGARYQIPWVAKNTGLSPEKLEELIQKAKHTQLLNFAPSQLVNVLKLNMLVMTEAKLTTEDLVAKRKAAQAAAEGK